jgi:glycosyltransferase involved in cell wall biosynthesis
MKLGIVVPRYGDDAVGGAEKAMRMIAERLVEWHGWQVEVFTTGARSAITWEDVEPAGRTEFNGVFVNRFHSVSGRDPEWHHIAERLEYSPTSLDPIGENMFVDQQGPVCPDMLDAAADSDCDLVAFSPYLFWPAIRGVPMLSDRAIVHGAAHDEPALQLELVQRMYMAARGISYYTDAERDLVERFYPVRHLPSVTLGLGIDTPDSWDDVESARAQFGLSDQPYVVCVGRVENGKGARALDAFHRLYCERHADAPVLVFVGPASEKLDPHPKIVMTDTVDEATKWALVEGAEVSISPSAMESFSMVILEAWMAGTPVLVNAQCGATVEHASRAGGGLWFGDYSTYEVALHRLMSSPGLRQQLATAGAAYTEATFAWPKVIDRYRTFCAQLLHH